MIIPLPKKMSYVLVSLIFFGCLVAAKNAQAANGSFAAGTGTASNPYQIEDCLDAQAMGSGVTASYILLNNIDCTATSGWNSGAGFAPIGSVSSPFSGTFDGNGFTIRGVTINRSDSAYTGFFGWVNTTGTISNVGLVNANVIGSSYTGTLIGTFEAGTLNKVFATGTVVNATVAYLGGLVGRNSAGTITNSYARVAVTSSVYSGGLVGLNNGGTVQNTYSTGRVVAVDSAATAGGLIGLKNAGTVTSSFYDVTTSGRNDNTGKGVPTSTTAMKLTATFTSTTLGGMLTAWDFVGNPNNDAGNSNYWDISVSVNDGYPFLSFIDATAPTVTFATSDKTNGSYTVSTIIDIDITFSERVTSTGDVTVTLETGDTDRTCVFSMTSATTGTCNYTVQAGDTSGDLTVGSLAGTILDGTGNSMSSFSVATNLAANKALIVDTTAPTITLVGATDVSLTQRQSYADAGATASDSQDGDLTGSITSSGSANTQVTGRYTITFSVSDTAGNTATNKYRTITVVAPDAGAIVIPSGTGTGASDRSLGMNEIGDIGSITRDGINYLAYINSQAGFSALASKTKVAQVYTLTITDVNLFIPQAVTFTIAPKLQRFTLPLGASTVIDVDTDGVPDVRVTFAHVWNNRVELTLVSVMQGESVSGSQIVTPNVIIDHAAAHPVVSLPLIFTHNLTVGMTDVDVKRLQIYLNTAGFLVTKSGSGSPGNETTYFGARTRAALALFQQANHITPAVGYFGAVTRKIVNIQ